MKDNLLTISRFEPLWYYRAFAECYGVCPLGAGLLPEDQHGKEGKDQQPHDPSNKRLIYERE